MIKNDGDSRGRFVLTYLWNCAEDTALQKQPTGFIFS